MSEEALLARIAARLTELGPTTNAGDVPGTVRVPVGDDAAVIAIAPGSDVVLSVDAHVEGVHFERAWMTLDDCGYRAVMAATSDLAAMGALARGVLLAIAAPGGTPDDDVMEVFEGALRATRAARMDVLGGNLTRARDLSVTTTVVGETRGVVLRRSGARLGDGLYVTGDVGLAALGRAVLAHADRATLERTAAGTVAVARYRAPVAKLVQGARLCDVASACIDVSDGLAIDAGRLARASSVRVRIATEVLAFPPDLDALAAGMGLATLPLALAGGDDYELLFTAPAGHSVESLGTRIGLVVEGEPGIELHDEHGREVAIPSGWDHFRT
ncbi:MAG: thiamine-phosphate kinase [Deltaproteobacteria bacterium]|nr:thiamine-phosphate kinase [Deltaproteobacteria bacterium]